MRAFFLAALLLQARESHTAAHYMLDGPIQGHCLDSTVQEVAHARILHKGWANLSLSSISLHVHCRAMQADCPKYYCTGSGPMRGFCIRAFRLLWANSSSSATSARLHRRPMRAFSMAALPLQARARVLYGSPIFC